MEAYFHEAAIADRVEDVFAVRVYRDLDELVEFLARDDDSRRQPRMTEVPEYARHFGGDEGFQIAGDGIRWPVISICMI